MGIGKFKRKLRNSKKGVSDLIANILILAITVTLFSSIMIYVSQMPTPQKNAYTDFTPSVRYLDSANQIELNLTHMGGQELVSNDIGFYIFVNDTRSALTPGQIISSVGDRWVIGETFSYKIPINPAVNPNIYKVRVSVMITDKEKNSMVYSANVVGGSSGVNTSPIIGARGTTPSPTFANTSFNFYAQITDLDNDLDASSVRIDLTSIGKGPSVQMNDSNGDGIFTSNAYIAQMAWNGKTVVITCHDFDNHEVAAQLTLSIQNQNSLVFNNNNFYNLTGPEDLLLNINYSGLQGFNIFNFNDWYNSNFSANPTTQFEHTDRAIVVVVSKYLVNLLTEDTMYVINPTFKTPLTQSQYPGLYEVNLDNTNPSETKAFTKYSPSYISGYYLYTSVLNLSRIPDNTMYSLQVQLKDTWIPNNAFFASAQITVGDVRYPTIKTYKDQAYSVECTNFTTYDLLTNNIYVEIENKYGGVWNQYGGDVEIRDFFWNAQLKLTPPATGWNGAVSNVTKVSANTYRFVISLANTTQIPWIAGQNSYVLRYDMFVAGNESYVLTQLIKIESPRFKMDFVTGINADMGTSAWTGRPSLYFFRNDNQWWPPDTLESISSGKKGAPSVILVQTADMNNDGKNDIVAVVHYTKEAPFEEHTDLIIYLNDGSWTSTRIAVLKTTEKIDVTALEVGNLDYDNDLDICVGFSNGVLSFYRNDGQWSKTVLDLNLISPSPALTSKVTSMKIADMDKFNAVGNDPNRSLDVVVGRLDGTIQIYKNYLGNGAIWQRLERTGSATVYDYASSETSLFGSVSGIPAQQQNQYYLNTINPTSNLGIYERLQETAVIRYGNSTPTGNDITWDTTLDDPTQLKPEPSGSIQVYTVWEGRTAFINQWDPSLLTNDVEIQSVVLNVKYYTENYNGNDEIKWGMGPNYPTNGTGIIIQNSGGLPTELGGTGTWMYGQYDLTGRVGLLAGSLVNLKVELNNTYPSAPPSAIHFDWWSLNITWKMADKLEHQWTIDVSGGNVPHYFELYASRSSPDTDAVHGEAFQFEYSLDGLTWVRMGAINVTIASPVNYGPYQLPNTAQTVYIRVNDTLRTPNCEVLDYIDIYRMHVRTATTVVPLGSPVRAIDIGDLNNDRSNDIVALTDSGNLWVGLNIGGNTLSTLALKRSDANIANAVGMSIGLFVNKDNNRDVAVVTSTRTYFCQGDGFGWLGPLTNSIYNANGVTFKTMAAGDINGDGRWDLLVGDSSGNIVILFNFQMDITGWQKGSIKQLLPMPINDIGLGKLQNA